MSEVTDALDLLKTKYQEQQTVDAAMKVLAPGLAAQVRALASTIVANNAANTAAKASLLEFADTVTADTADMAAKVVESTIAEDEPPAEPPTTEPPVATP